MSYNKDHLLDAKPSEQMQYEQQILSDSLNLQLTIDELKILKECQRNSMWGRGFPLGIATAGGLHYLMKTNVIRRNTLSLVIGGLSGFVVGVLSYRQTCMDKLLSLPNSTLKERILIAQGQKPQVRIDVQSQENQGWFDSILPNSDESPMSSSLDIAPYQNRNDYPITRPDADTAYAVDPPLQPLIGTPYTTYDDLRQRNRETYENERNRRGPQPPNYPPRPPMGPPPPGFDRSFDSQAPPQPSSSRRDDFL